ncbi:MAG: leucine-rich repeat protein [Muribaculaceae bacterium]|nr:leucine-rich repeat protein [Muribaculaceae bacterium]
MKTSRKLLTAALVMIGLTTISAATVVEVDGINYEIDADNQTAIVKHGNYTGDINIKRHITYHSKDIVVTRIEQDAFRNSSITSLTIEDSVTLSNLPDNCQQLQHIQLPRTQKSLSGECNCPLLTEIEIPEGIEVIGNGTFRKATGLESIYLPSTVQSVGIIGSDKMETIEVSPDNPYITVVNDWVMNNDHTILYGGLYKNLTQGQLIIPEGVEEVKCSFQNITVQQLSLPTSLKKMPYFSQCNINTVVRWPESFPVIDNKYFSGYLKGLIVPASVTAIKEYAFGKGTLTLDELIIEDSDEPLTAGCLFSDFSDVGMYTINWLKGLYLGRDFNFQPEHTEVDGGSIIWHITSDNVLGDQNPKVFKIGKYIDFNENGYIKNPMYYTALDTLGINHPVPPTWHPFISNNNVFITTTLLVPRGSLQRYQNDEWWGQFWEILEVNCDAFPMGDVNHDCIIDVEDVNRVINMILKLDDSNSISDMNGDGIIDVEDVNAIINIILKL